MNYCDKDGKLDLDKLHEFLNLVLRKPLSKDDPVIALSSYIKEHQHTLPHEQLQAKFKDLGVFDVSAVNFCRGYSRDRAPELGQFCMFLMAFSLDSIACPIFAETYSGNVNDIQRNQL